jgi:hypothetical protein
MEPTYNQQPGALSASTPNSLPEPQPLSQAAEQAPQPANYNQLPAVSGEQAPVAAAPSLPVLAQPAAVAVTPTTTSVTATGMPAMADDGDLIEKEWVVKAKQIIGKTKEDPYTQSRELNKMRAEYIKKRYNKDVKLAE